MAAPSVAARKNANPHLYCPDPKCLWMTGDGRHCPRHGGPEWDTRWEELARRISRGEITVALAHELYWAGPNG